MFAHGSVLRQVEKAVIAALAFGVPVLVNMFPEIANLTIGAVAYGLVSWLQSVVTD